MCIRDRCGAGIGPGITMICKYVYWSKPENKVRYNEKVKIEKIEMVDENVYKRQAFLLFR